MAIRFHTSSFRKKSTSDGGVGLILFGVFWTLFSLIFVALGVWTTLKELQSGGWEKVPCVIERFEILDDDSEKDAFEVAVRYRYTVAGREYLGMRLFQNTSRQSDYFKLAKLQADFLGWSDHGKTNPSPIHCLVNPADPEEAVLVQDQGSIAGGLIFAAAGLGFVGVGIGLILTGIHGVRKRKRGATAVTSKAKAGQGAPLAILFPFFSVFALAGIGVFIGVIVPMWLGWLRAKSWQETPAEVIWSRVETSNSRDGSTYRPRIFYQYTWQDREHRSDRYRFSTVSSSGLKGKQSIVATHPGGKQTTCFVNPNAPWEAVLDRRLGAFAWFTLFPIPFMLIGIGGLWWAIRQVYRKSAKEVPANATGRAATESVPKNQRLHTGKNRLKELAGAIFIAAFWNGIVSVFLYQVISEWRSGASPWFLTLFLIPFVTIGTGLIGAVVWTFLGLFGPRLALQVDTPTPRLGEPLRISWRFTKGPYPIERLVIRLIAKETSASEDSEKAHRNESVFFEQVMHDSGMQKIDVEGQAIHQLPETLMPSWSSEHHAIEWAVEIHGNIRIRPDIKGTLPITIEPTAMP